MGERNDVLTRCLERGVAVWFCSTERREKYGEGDFRSCKCFLGKSLGATGVGSGIMWAGVDGTDFTFFFPFYFFGYFFIFVKLESIIPHFSHIL